MESEPIVCDATSDPVVVIPPGMPMAVFDPFATTRDGWWIEPVEFRAGQPKNRKQRRDENRRYGRPPGARHPSERWAD